MNEVKIFENEEFGQIRTVDINGKPYFIASDVAKALGYINDRDAIARHCRWVVKHDIPHPQSIHKALLVNVIPQGDIVRLASNSELPGAEKFESWIYDEVIPSVLNHGMYAVDELLDNPDLLISVATALKEEREKRKALQEENRILLPKAQYFDGLVDRNLLTSFRDTAKEFCVKEKTFIQWLQDNGYIYRDQKGKLKPYADKNRGLFELKEFSSRFSEYADTQTLITPKGRETFRLLLKVS